MSMGRYPFWHVLVGRSKKYALKEDEECYVPLLPVMEHNSVETQWEGSLAYLDDILVCNWILYLLIYLQRVLYEQGIVCAGQCTPFCTSHWRSNICTVACSLISMVCWCLHLAGVLYLPTLKQHPSGHEMSIHIEVVQAYVQHCVRTWTIRY